MCPPPTIPIFPPNTEFSTAPTDSSRKWMAADVSIYNPPPFFFAKFRMKRESTMSTRESLAGMAPPYIALFCISVMLLACNAALSSNAIAPSAASVLPTTELLKKLQDRHPTRPLFTCHAPPLLVELFLMNSLSQ